MGKSDSGLDIGVLLFWAIVAGIIILVSGLTIYAYW